MIVAILINQDSARQDAIALEAYLPPNSPRGLIGHKAPLPYDLTTRSIMGEYIGWIGLSPPANYPIPSGDLATL